MSILLQPAHTGVNRPEPVPSPTSVLPFVTSPKPPAIVSITTKQPATFQEDPCPLGYKLTAGKCRPSYLHNKWHPYSHLPFYQPINFGNFHSPLYPLFHHPANSCWQSSPLAYNNKYWGYPYYGGGYPHSALYGLQPWLNKFCPPGYHVLHGRCEPPQRVSISMNPS
ncbi:uncharacterized protein LOC132205223 [Neocloeon triangulifer]|uniref:uncharacterized protein LOC132205223 n=1 Tax=Neocloeon triangulifer TaxID=2078957 RepID=UPI00286EEB49|nr:uncharacterized protein LOC132205223 [Neocloeon triangulifer]